MRTDIKFTEEELLFIEQTMDLNASLLDHNIHQICEDFILSQTTNNEELKRLIANRIVENGRTQIITKSIRDKIEELRNEKNN